MSKKTKQPKNPLIALAGNDVQESIPEKAAVDFASVVDSHKFQFGGATFDGNDIAQQAIDIDQAESELEGLVSTFGAKFLAMASTCVNVADFLNLTTAIEAENSFKSKQNPAGANTAPKMFVQYKSNVKVAWEKGIAPTSVDTMSKLSKALQAKRKATKEQAEAEQTAQAEGEVIAEAVQTSNLLANVLGAIATTYDRLPETDQADLLEALQAVTQEYSEIADLVEHMEEEQEEEQEAVTG